MVPSTHLLAFALFTVLKLAGACYLVYLGVQAIRHRRSLAESLGATIEAKTTTPLQIIALGAIFAGIALISDSTWALAAGTVRAWLASSPRRLALLGGTGGVAMIAIGARLAFTGRQD